MERALNVGVKHVATFMSASQTHNRKNLNRTQLESLENIRIVTEMALDEGATVRAYLSTALDAHARDVSINTVEPLNACWTWNIEISLVIRQAWVIPHS